MKPPPHSDRLAGSDDGRSDVETGSLLEEGSTVGQPGHVSGGTVDKQA